MKLDANEPVRRIVYLAAAVVALSTFFGGMAVAAVITVQVVFGALGAALGQFGLIAFGAELARVKAWGPQTVDRIIDAEADIADAERRGLDQ